MKKSTRDNTFDTCEKCGKRIRYDKSDGYWDNLTKMEDGTAMWTPFNCVNDNTPHEPINHKANDMGYYFPIKSESEQSTKPPQ